jgi:hypothetical protein
MVLTFPSMHSNQSSLPMHSTANKIAPLVSCKSIRIHFHHFTSSHPSLPEKTPKAMADKGNNHSRRTASHQRSEPFESNLFFSLPSLDFQLQSHDSSSFDFSLDLLPRKYLALKKFLSTSFPTPLLKKKPHRNRGPVTNCAVASDI